MDKNVWILFGIVGIVALVGVIMMANTGTIAGQARFDRSQLQGMMNSQGGFDSSQLQQMMGSRGGRQGFDPSQLQQMMGEQGDIDPADFQGQFPTDPSLYTEGSFEGFRGVGDGSGSGRASQYRQLIQPTMDCVNQKKTSGTACANACAPAGATRDSADMAAVKACLENCKNNFGAQVLDCVNTNAPGSVTSIVDECGGNAANPDYRAVATCARERFKSDYIEPTRNCMQTCTEPCANAGTPDAASACVQGCADQCLPDIQ